MTGSLGATDALDRLRVAFPLGDRLALLDPGTRAVHRSILMSYLESGGAPAIHDLDAEALAALMAADAVVVREGRIVGAYPFSGEATGHAVTVGAVTVGCMCSVDALAVAPVFEVEATVTSVCAVTGVPITVVQPGPVADAVHVGIHFQDPTGPAASSLCREMVFLRDAAAAAEWRGRDPAARGVLDLAAGIELARAFFAPVVAP